MIMGWYGEEWEKWKGKKDGIVMKWEEQGRKQNKKIIKKGTGNMDENEMIWKGMEKGEGRKEQNAVEEGTREERWSSVEGREKETPIAL